VDKEKFAKRLKQSREKVGISQKELAAKLGVKRSTVGSWESAHRSPEIEKAYGIAEALNVSVDYLLCRSDDPKLKQIKESGDLEKIEKLKKTMDMAFLEVREIMEKYTAKKVE